MKRLFLSPHLSQCDVLSASQTSHRESWGRSVCVHAAALKEAALNFCVLSPRNSLMSNLVPTEDRGGSLCLCSIWRREMKLGFDPHAQSSCREGSNLILLKVHKSCIILQGLALRIRMEHKVNENFVFVVQPKSFF